MRAVVCDKPVVQSQTVIPLDVAACVFQWLEIPLAGRKASQRVHHQVDVHTRLCALSKYVQYFAGYLARVKDIGFHIDAITCLAHGLQLCLVKVFAVLDHLNLIVTRDFGTHQCFQLIQECRRVNCHCGTRDKRIFQPWCEQSD